MRLGSDQKERFDQMVEEVNFRKTEFLFSGTTDHLKDKELSFMLKTMIDEFLTVGPFGEHFIWNKDSLKDSFYNIPLQHAFGDRLHCDPEMIAFVATNQASCVLMKGIYDYLRQPNKLRLFSVIDMDLIAVQTAVSPADERRIVVGMDRIKGLRPHAMYEHPANGRLFQATIGVDIPEQAALVMAGRHYAVPQGIQHAYMEATAIYNDYELGNLDDEEFRQAIRDIYEEE